MNLFEASASGDLERVKELIENSPYRIYNDMDYNQTIPKTALMHACENGHLDIVKYLIEKGADINKPNYNKYTALTFAAKNGHLEIVKYLIDKGAYTNIKTDDFRDREHRGYTPLMFASKNGYLEIVKYLVEKGGADINIMDGEDVTALYYSSLYNHFEIVKYLVEKGGDVNIKNAASSPLIAASTQNNLEIVKYLVEKAGADINLKNNTENTAIMFASARGNLEIVKYLVEKGADINIKGQNKNTALIFAAIEGQLEVVKYLVEKGADIEARDVFGNTSLIHATDNLEIVKYLIEKGAEINVTSVIERTPLMYASMDNHLDVVKYLIEKGADINIEDHKNMNAIKYAIKEGNLEIAEFLLEKGAYPFDVVCPKNGKKEECENLLNKYIWRRLYNRDMKLATEYSKSGDVKLPKEIWEIILLNKRQQQLCQKLESDKNRGVLLLFAEEMGIPVSKDITKGQLCGIISTNLAYGKRYSEMEQESLVKKKKQDEKLIKQLAYRFGLDINRPIKDILRDLSNIF